MLERRRISLVYHFKEDIGLLKSQYAPYYLDDEHFSDFILAEKRAKQNTSVWEFKIFWKPLKKNAHF